LAWNLKYKCTKMMGALGYELFVGLATQVIDPVRKEELVWLTPPDSFIIYIKYSRKLRGVIWCKRCAGAPCWMTQQ